MLTRELISGVFLCCTHQICFNFHRQTDLYNIYKPNNVAEPFWRAVLHKYCVIWNRNRQEKHICTVTGNHWTSSVLVGNSSPVGVEEIPLCSRGVSDRRVASPGPVFTSDGRIRRQPCGRYDSNPSCLYLAVRHGPLQRFRSPKGRATPLGNVRNINSILRLSDCETAIFRQPHGVQFALWRRVSGGLFGDQSKGLG